MHKLTETKHLDEKISSMFKLAIEDQKKLFNNNPIAITSSIDGDGNIVISIGDQTATITKDMVNQQDSDGNSIFLLTLMACKRPANVSRQWYYEDNSAQEKLFEQLLSLGVTPEILNIQNNKGETALFHSAALNNIKLTKLLLEQGADAKIKNTKGYAPISLAVDYPLEISTLLLEGGADPNTLCYSGNTLLHLAAERTDLEFAKQLLERGAIIDAKNDNNNTPLHIHCSVYKSSTGLTDMTLGREYSTTEFTKLLLKYNPSIDIINNQKQTPIDIAKASRNPDLIGLLVKTDKAEEKPSEAEEIKGEEVLIEGQDSSLHKAIRNDDINAVRALLAKKIPGLINHKGYHGYSPLHIAVRKNKIEVARLLIDNHADLDFQDTEGSTALFMACYVLDSAEDAFKFATLLVENKAQLNIQNNISKSTALHLVVRVGHYPLTKLLIAHGADLTIKDANGKTALFLAVERGDLPLVELLIANGADLSPPDPNIQNPMTALDLANAVKPINKDIIKFLEEKMRAQPAELSEQEEQPSSDELKENKKSETEEKPPLESVEQSKPMNFYDKLCGEKSAAKLVDYMDWKAHPKVRTKDIEKFIRSDSAIKQADFSFLTQNKEIQRTLFNLGVYSSMLPKGTKKNALNTFLTELSGKSPEQAEKLIQAALKNETLIKNTGFGFYKFFHSGPRHIVNSEMNDRWARSTTEELLIALNEALKKPADLEEEEDHSHEDHSGLSQ